MLWFLPLLLTPIFLIELLVCFTFCGVKQKLAYFTAIALAMAAWFALSHGEQRNTAIWSTATGFVLHESLKPRAILPRTLVVRVKAAALNPVDYKVFNHFGSVPFLRWFLPHAPMVDIAGVVVESNCGAQGAFAPGDEVFGNGLGGAQEYAVMLCRLTAKIPPRVKFTQAAATSTVMFTALTGLRNFPRNSESSLVILGASGGCGQAAILLAKQRNVEHIICVASEKNRAAVMQRGCTEFYNYQEGADFFTKLLGKWRGKTDLVYDTVSSIFDNPYFPQLHELLREDTGRYVALIPVVDKFRVGGDVYKRFETFREHPLPEEIAFLAQTPALFETNIAMELDALNVDNVNRAYNALKTHRTVGKIVLTIGDQERSTK